ncbi:hypothetical protein HY251_06915 [bacterium]|nr:hypothetical protein [bacterium]
MSPVLETEAAPDQGLSEEEAALRLAQLGPNELVPRKRASRLRKDPPRRGAGFPAGRWAQGSPSRRREEKPEACAGPRSEVFRARASSR